MRREVTSDACHDGFLDAHSLEQEDHRCFGCLVGGWRRWMIGRLYAPDDSLFRDYMRYDIRVPDRTFDATMKREGHPTERPGARFFSDRG